MHRLLSTAGVQKVGKVFQITEEQRQELDTLLTKLVRKGQPLTHIYATHKDEIPVSLMAEYKVWAYPNSPGTYPCSTRWVYPL